MATKAKKTTQSTQEKTRTQLKEELSALRRCLRLLHEKWKGEHARLELLVGGRAWYRCAEPGAVGETTDRAEGKRYAFINCARDLEGLLDSTKWVA